ncbi:MAG TPA: glutathione S-transferase family protein [Thermoanaerobaculia bacterium]|nr:glutathione S-transferase family protein [Thermoanaerobaculia bacterium]
MAKPASDGYRIIGAEASPYSVKVRSYFRSKGIPHAWQVRTPAIRAELERLARLPLIPVVVTPEGEALQDSTPILEEMERRHPEPAIQPADPTLGFLSALVEELADEWGNKWMFHYRWAREVDQRAAAARIAAEVMPDLDGADRDAPDREALVEGLRQRMLSRVWFVGSSSATAPIIEGSFVEALDGMERHFAARPYLFGARPALADFGLWGQVYEAWCDPTPGALVAQRPTVVAWVERMLEPFAEGGFEKWETLAPTLEPWLRRQAGDYFLPWSDANARALMAGQESFTVELAGGAFTQRAQKYHARSLAALRAKYREAASDELDRILERVGCLELLRGA